MYVGKVRLTVISNKEIYRVCDSAIRRYVFPGHSTGQAQCEIELERVILASPSKKYRGMGFARRRGILGANRVIKSL